MSDNRPGEMAMGDGLRAGEETSTFHTAINNLLTYSRIASPQGAVIVQQKKIPDVSFYQGVVNWDVMRTKTDAVIIRAGQNIWVDKQFVRNWAEARRVGMFRSSYWFYDDRISPRRQADIWIGLLKGDKPEMEIWVDWEINYGGAYQGLARVCEMMQYMEAAGYTVGIYTGYYFFRANSNAITNAAQYNYLRTRLLWEAWYTNNAGIVLIPAPFTSLYLWQFGTPSAIGWGVQSLEIDMSYINLTEAQFYDKYGGAIPPPNGGTVNYSGNVKTIAYGKPVSQLNVRNQPNLTTSRVIGSMAAGMAYTGDTIVPDPDGSGREWMHLITPMSGYASAGYLTIDSPPPSSGAPLKAVVTMPDGAQWEATQFTKL
jgi:hypothetical protein